MTRAPLPPINFEALARALLDRADTLVPMWLPGGTRRGHEWVCGSLSGGQGVSCSVNLVNGKWADFAGDDKDKGGDLLSLYAAINGLDQGKAAVQVARDLGLEDVAGVQRDAGHKPTPAPAAPPPPEHKPREDEGWRAQLVVPDNAPPVNFRHHARRQEDIEHTAEYRTDGFLHGYVVRFRTSDGGKDPIPRTWCTSTRDGASKWHWKQWDEPRPLYFPAHSKPAGRTVVLVEGEKKADVLQALLEAGAPGVYCVASWPGGSKAWQKACWDWLAGSTVLAWPDCDAKREPLTKAERDAHQDPAGQAIVQQSKPLLPEAKQPGMKAMLGIGALLRDAHGCMVQLLPIPKPGDVVDGWDCADAINTDGWDIDNVLALFGRAQPLPADADTPAPREGGGGAGDGGGGKKIDGPAEAGDSDDAFSQHLDWLCEQMKIKRWELGVNRSLLIAALRKAPYLQDCLGYDELRNAPCTRAPWPWRDKAGPIKDSDDLRFGDWLVRTYHVKAASRAALTEAIDTVADERHFHPITDWLKGLQHDGVPRLERWLIHVLGLKPDDLPARRRRYLELMGKYILMGLVARVMDPGCKFDYSPVFEGRGGVGKSTLVKVLVGAEFFSDTHFDIGNGKDGMEQLEGLWAYELSELTAFKRADSEQIKQFFSSTVDRFRGAYGRYVQPHARQCVIFCTTNKRQYLYDLTGNRRFWPWWIEQRVRLEWLRKWREQLFAEAFAAYQAGARYYPDHETEEIPYFWPEQELRLVETAVQSRLYELLTREGSMQGEGKTTEGLNVLTKFVTLNQLVGALGADAAKSTSLLEQQIRGWLESMGWESAREGGGQRRRGYRAPTVWPPEIKEDEETPGRQPGEDDDEPPEPAGSPSGGDDDEPF